MSTNNTEIKSKNGEKVILGLGKTGFSCARYFSRLGVPFSVMDAREQPDLLAALHALEPRATFTQLVEETTFDPRKIEELVVSPGIPLSTLAIQRAIADGIGVNGDVNIFLQQAVVPVVGITGSNGKSTVTALLGEILTNAGMKVGVGGNIGTPCLDLLEADCDIYVLELSSYQLETISDARCEIATVLNLSPDHMDRYVNDIAYYSTKAKIYSNANIALQNSDLEFEFSFDKATEVFNFSGNKPNSPTAYGVLEDETGVFLCQGPRKIVDCNNILIRGRHNAENALAATAIAERLGVSSEVIATTLASFRGLAHRCEFVAEQCGRTFINDSKSTNPGSTIAAINGFVKSGSSLTVMLGGQSKGADFSVLRETLIQTQCKVVLYGEDALLLEESLHGCTLARAATLNEAFDKAVESTVGSRSEGQTDANIVLFSPACASFDQFVDFEDRGEKFKALVKECCS